MTSQCFSRNEDKMIFFRVRAPSDYHAELTCRRGVNAFHVPNVHPKPS